MYPPDFITDGHVERAAAGDSSARADVLAWLEPRIRTMVLVRLAPSPRQFVAVDDLAQETLMATMEGLAKLRVRTLAGLRSFSSTVASRRVADFLRAQPAADGHGPGGGNGWVRNNADSLHLVDSTLTPRRRAERIEEVARLIEALGRLQPEQREVIVMAYYDQIETHEMAERLGVSRPAAAMKLLRATRALRSQVGAARSERRHDPA